MEYRQMGNTFKSASLCVIHDSEVLKEGLKSLLSSIEGISESEGLSRTGYLNLPSNKEYDVIITEIEFKNEIDVDFIRRIKETSKNSKIIVYTNIKNTEHRNYAMHCGADFFLYMEDKYNLLEHLVSGLISYLNK